MSEKQPWKDKDRLEQMYHEKGMSTVEMADKLGCTAGTISYWMNKFNIDTKKPMHERPPCHTYTNSGHEVWRTLVDGDQLGVYVHRLLAVAEFGYNMIEDNDVHHKNNIPWDNRYGNLELIEHKEHTRLHQSNSENGT